MNHHARTLLVVATTTAALVAVTGVAHAAGTTRPTGATVTTPATTASTKATTVTTKPASSPKTTATTKRSTTTTAPVVTTTVPAGPAVYRVQAGAATNTTTARKLAAIAIAADKPAGFIITASKAHTITTYRVVSGCRSLADATAIKTTLNAHHIATLVYRSQRC